MGRGSKIFIIAFLISAAVFGLVSFSLVTALSNMSAPLADPGSLSDGAVQSSTDGTSESFNLLIVNVDFRPEAYSYNRARVNALFGNGYSCGVGDDAEIRMLSAVILRLDRERGEITFTPVPARAYIKIDGGMSFLASVYETRGAEALCDQVHLLTGLEIDEYAVIIPSAAATIAESVGGLPFDLISSVSAPGEVSVQSGRKNLTGAEVRTLLLADYEGQSLTREQVASELSRAFIERLAEGGEVSTITLLKGFLSFIKTSVDADRIDKSAGLIAELYELDRREISLCGKYSGGYFTPDVAATIERFQKYRKYYG